jgi:two-component system sensor histidine kinase AlgZ
MLVIGLTEWPVEYALVRKSALTILGFLLSLALWGVFRLQTRLGIPRPLMLLSAIPLSYAASVVWMTGHNFAIAFYLGAERGQPRLALDGFPDITNAIYYSFLLMAWSALYFGGQAYLDLVDQRERSLRAEAELQRARLRALRLQVNPHFLFNTLNGIATLVSEGQAAAANRMLSRLSQFLRTTLDRPDVDEVTLAEEIDVIRQYLAIEQIRFGDRLTLKISITHSAAGVPVPPLILQPLVENALRHGILRQERGGTISIEAGCDGGWLQLVVRDDGPGLMEDALRTDGIGLTNVRARLAELHGDRGVLSLARSSTGGTEAMIRIPAGN